MPIKPVPLSDLERDVVLSLLETALSAWEGNQKRQDAAERVVKKIYAVDRGEL